MWRGGEPGLQAGGQLHPGRDDQSGGARNVGGGGGGGGDGGPHETDRAGRLAFSCTTTAYNCCPGADPACGRHGV